jgi:hypothetical protein
VKPGRVGETRTRQWPQDVPVKQGRAGETRTRRPIRQNATLLPHRPGSLLAFFLFLSSPGFAQSKELFECPNSIQYNFSCLFANLRVGAERFFSLTLRLSTVL